MSKSFTTITSDVAKALGTLRKEIPETMQGFNALSKAALASGALSALDKELIALAIGVAVELRRVRRGAAVVAGVAPPIGVAVFLRDVGDARAVVAGVADAVGVAVGL